MNQFRIGMSVLSVRDQHIGTLMAVNPCCLLIDRRDALGHLAVKPGAVYDVQFQRVVLICDQDQVHRYACGMHSSRQVERSTGTRLNVS
jgi:hypothetical protein